MSTSFAATIQSNLTFLTEIYKANQTESENKQDLLKCARLNLRLCQATNILLAVTCSIFLAAPILTYVITDRLETIHALCIPFIRHDTIMGYSVQTIFQLTFMLIGLCVTTGTDVFLVTMTMQYWPLTRIFDRSVRNLSLATPDQTLWLRMNVRNIVLMHEQIYK